MKAEVISSQVATFLTLIHINGREEGGKISVVHGRCVGQGRRDDNLKVYISFGLSL